MPKTSYCGFKYPGDGTITKVMKGSGAATLSFGNSWGGRSMVHVYLNGKEIGKAKKHTPKKSVTLKYKSGDKLKITELGDGVMVINSLKLTPTPKKAPGK